MYYNNPPPQPAETKNCVSIFSVNRADRLIVHVNETSILAAIMRRM